MNDDMMFFGSRSTNLFASSDNNEQMLLPGSIDSEVGLLLPAVQKATGGDPSPTTRLPEIASIDEILIGGNPSALAGIEPDDIDVRSDSDFLIGATPIDVSAIDDFKALLPLPDDQTWSQDTPGIKYDSEAYDFFGQAVTTGDFNGDGYVDLAVGAPGEDVFDIANAGAVNVLYGSANGLTAVGDQIWHQNSGQAQASPVLSSVAEAGDNFGASLTSPPQILE